MARLFGAATPQVPSAAAPIPRHPKPVRHWTPSWNDDSPSAALRASRHQGPPVQFRNSPSNDRAGQHAFDAFPPPMAQDVRHQRRNFGSRPAMHSRPKAPVAAASVARSSDQPAVPSQPESNTHTEVTIVYVLIAPLNVFLLAVC